MKPKNPTAYQKRTNNKGYRHKNTILLFNKSSPARILYTPNNQINKTKHDKKYGNSTAFFLFRTNINNAFA